MPSIASIQIANNNPQRSVRLRRIYNPETKKYLHQSGQGWVSGTQYAWSGLKYQAAELAKRDPDKLRGCTLVRVNTSATKINSDRPDVAEI